jgi:hypothetical protein
MATVLHAVYPTLIPVAEELRGPRIILRRYHERDASDLLAALEASRLRLAPWLRFPNRLQTVEATRDWLIHRESKWLLREALGFAIRHRQKEEYLGGVDLHSIAWDRCFFALGNGWPTALKGRVYERGGTARDRLRLRWSGPVSSSTLRCPHAGAAVANSWALCERHGCALRRSPTTVHSSMSCVCAHSRRSPLASRLAPASWVGTSMGVQV